MFNPEFRYLIVQDGEGDQVRPNIDYLMSGLLVCVINLTSVLAVGLATYKVFAYSGIISKYLFTSFWNMLTPGNEFLEIIMIISSLVAGTVMFLSLKGMSEVIDSNFVKLKNLLSEKDARIKELEDQVRCVESMLDDVVKQNKPKIIIPETNEIEE